MIELYEIIYTPAALNDLKAIYVYIAEKLMAEQTAGSQVNRIRSGIRSLNRAPGRFALVDWEPWMSMKMHKMSVDNDVVFFQIDAESRCVTVVRIFYGGRDIKSIVQTEIK